MVKTLKIGDREVAFSTAFAWTFVYKAQFGKDPSKIMIPTIIKAFSAKDDTERTAVFFEDLGVICIAQIAWAMARLCDDAIPDFVAWITELGDDFCVMDIMEELIPETVESFFTSKNSQTPSLKELKKVTE